MMSKILLLLLPLLFLDGAHLDSDGFGSPQPGKPWVAPTFMMNSTDSMEEMSKENDFDLDQYDSQFYETPAPEKPYTKPPKPQQRSENGLPGYRCPQPNGYFKYTDRCDEYVKCQNFIPIPYTCPIGLHFNVYLQWTEVPCDHPSRVQCDSESGNQKLIPSRPPPTTTTTTTTTTPAPQPPTPKAVPDDQSPNFMCPQPFGYFKHNYECADYVECKNYIPIIFTCPLGRYFNPRAQWTEYPCDHPSRVECNRQPDGRQPRYPYPVPIPKPIITTTTTTTTTTTPPPPIPTPGPKLVPTPRPGSQINDFICPHPHGYYRYTDQCGEYIECKNYVPLTYSCPVGLHFNPLVPWTQYPCDYPSNVQCNREPATSEIPPPPTTTTTTTTPPPPSSSTTEPAPRPKTPQPNNLCPQPHGYFKHSNKCGEYVECKNYTPLLFICPIGLHFNPQAQWTEYPCAHPSQVQCEEEPSNPKGKSPLTPRPIPRPVTTTSPPPTTQAPATPGPKVVTPRPGGQLVGFKCPEPHGYFEHSGQCGEYVECKNHVPLSYSCPAGLHFNPRVQWTDYPCDHPSKAQCESRLK